MQLLSSIIIRCCYQVTVEVWGGVGPLLMSLMVPERRKGICLLPSSLLRIRGPGLVKESGLKLNALAPNSTSSRTKGLGGDSGLGCIVLCGHKRAHSSQTFPLINLPRSLCFTERLKQASDNYKHFHNS